MTLGQSKELIAKLNIILYPLGIVSSMEVYNLELPGFVHKLLRNEQPNPNNDDTPTRFGPRTNPRETKDMDDK